MAFPSSLKAAKAVVEMAKKETYLFCCPDSGGNCDSFGFEWYRSRHFKEMLHNCVPKTLEAGEYISDVENAIIYVDKKERIIVLGLGSGEISRDLNILGPKDKLPEGSCSVGVYLIEGKTQIDEIRAVLIDNRIGSKNTIGFWKGNFRTIC